MPEFAEVNKQVGWLRSRVVGWRVTGVKFTPGHFPALKDDPARAKKLAAFFEGATIEAVTQRGKHVVLALSTGTVTSHLMFKGRWTLRGEDYVSNYKHHREPPVPKATSFWLETNTVVTADGAPGRLEFNEPEYKGKVHAHPGLTAGQCADLRELGPDILQTPESDPAFAAPFTVEGLIADAARTKTPIKVLLLDQKKQAGIGNMYACEALYRAGVAPARPSNTLTEPELRAVHAAVQAVVQESIDSDLDYDRVLAVYRRDTDPQGRIVKCDDVGGRDTFWVPAAQR